MNLFLLDAFSCVAYVHLQLFQFIIISRSNGYPAVASELQCVLRQVDKNLLESDLVAQEFDW